jgi:hypothetical protein
VETVEEAVRTVGEPSDIESDVSGESADASSAEGDQVPEADDSAKEEE